MKREHLPEDVARDARSKRSQLLPEPENNTGPSDTWGALGLFAMVGLMGLCCGVLPLVIAGVISASAIAAGLPWLGGIIASGAGAWWLVRWRKYRRQPECKR